MATKKMTTALTVYKPPQTYKPAPVKAKGDDMGMGKAMSGMMMMMGAMIAISMAMSMIASAEPITYTAQCPICGETFTANSQAEATALLEAHFASEHPTEPIDIIWS